MKKLLTAAALIGATSFALAQGTVNFSAGATVASRAATNTIQGGPSTGLIGGAGGAVSPNAFYFALFVAPSTVTTLSNPSLDPTLSGFTFAGYYGTNGATGRFSGNPGTDFPTITGYATSSSASFMVLGWSANVTPNGPNWAAVQGAITGTAPVSGAYFFGESGIATSVQLGGGAISAGNIFGGNPGQLANGFLLGLQVPEPTTVALAGLGAAAMLIFRRRK